MVILKLGKQVSHPVFVYFFSEKNLTRLETLPAEPLATQTPVTSNIFVWSPRKDGCNSCLPTTEHLVHAII